MKEALTEDLNLITSKTDAFPRCKRVVFLEIKGVFFTVTAIGKLIPRDLRDTLLFWMTTEAKENKQPWYYVFTCYTRKLRLVVFNNL